MKYKIIYADPPWSYNDQGCNGTMAAHYKGMTIEDIKALPIGEIADKDCVLFLWATYPMLPEALEVIAAWGFTYKTIGFQWVKSNRTGWGHFYGLGRWTRGNTEPCLLAVKGKPKRVRQDIFQLINAPLTRHSEKPNDVRLKIVDLMGDLPRVELFARKRFEGWDAWGNEVTSDVTMGKVEAG